MKKPIVPSVLSLAVTPRTHSPFSTASAAASSVSFVRRSFRLFLQILSFAILAAASPLAEAADFFVAPSGSSSGDGSINRPWNLQTALSHPLSVRPGDTIWLRDGVYSGTFSSRLTGASGQPITVRQYPGEQAIIDGVSSSENTLTVSGAWATFWGFELRNTNPSRPNVQWTRPHGITLIGPNTKCINLIVHDAGQGFGAWSSSPDAEIYGCVIYNNGNSKFDHGIYTQNQLGTKRVRDNIIFNNFGYGLHIYGSESAALSGYDVEGNTIFNNGSLSFLEAQNVIIGGGVSAERIRVLNNYTYSGFKQGTVNIGSVNDNKDLVVQNNYFVDFTCIDTWLNVTFTDNTVVTPNTILELRTSYFPSSTPYIWDRNTYFSEENPWKPFMLTVGSSQGLYFPDWRAKIAKDNNSTYTKGRPGGTKVFIRPNAYEPGRANITVYNWSRQSSVNVDLSSFLSVGTSYEIRNGQNFLAPPVLSGTYAGGAVTLPMYGLSVAEPIGLTAPAATGPDFNVFVVLPIAAPPTPPSPANTAPTLSSFSSVAIDEDGTTSALPFTIGDSETSAANLSVLTSSSNPTLIPNANLRLGGSDANRTLTITPVANQSGTANITVSVSDGSLLTTKAFGVTVNPVNDTPTISNVPNLTIDEDTPAASVNFSIGDIDTPVDSLVLTTASSNQALLPNANISLTGAGANRSIGVVPAPNQSGTATISISVSDGSSSASRTFTLTVNPVNDSPTASTINDQTISEDTSSAAIGFTIGDPETTAGNLIVTASSSNPTLLPDANLRLGGTGANRTIVATPATGQSGVATVTVSVSDGQATTKSSFNLTVTAINHAPTISFIGDYSVNEDGPSSTIGFTVGDSETAAGNLIVSGTSSNPTLVSILNSNFGGTGANRTLSIAPAPNQYGSATITVTVTDGSLTATRSFGLSVDPINDPPTIASIPNQTINQDTSTAALPVAIGDIDNAADSLTLQGSSSNTTLVPNANIRFSGTGANRSVTITPASGKSGTATITISVGDSSVSSSTSFTLTVNAVAVQTPPPTNPTPTPSSKVYLSLEAEAGVLAGAMGMASDANASQGKYITSAVPNQGTATFTFNVPTAGEYIVWGRVLAKDGSDRGSHDSFFVSMDGVEDVYDVAEGRWANYWQWTPVNGRGNGGPLSLNPRKFNLTAGSHTLVIRGRETLTFLDALLITNDAAFVPSGTGGTPTPAPSVNAAPTISPINDQTISEDTSSAAIGFTIGDAETTAGNLIVTATSANTSLVSNSSLNLGGTGPNRTITVSPVANQSGTAQISVSVSDGTLTTTIAFKVTVSPVNDAPSISSIPNQTINQDTSTSALSFTIGDLETAADTLTLQGSSSNTTLVPNGNIRFSGTGPNRSVTITPAAGQSGSATITVAVGDGATTTATSLTLTVTAITPTPSPTPSGKVYLALEAEAGVLAGPMSISSDSLANQGKYISSSSPNQGTATFNVNIPTAGEYVIWCRVLALDGPDRGNHDSYFVSMDGVEDVYDVAEGRWSSNWQWTQVNGRAGSTPLTLNPRKFTLSAGTHTLVFRGREAMTMLDGFVITNDPAYVPPAR